MIALKLRWSFLYAVAAVVEALFALRALLKGNETTCAHLILLMNQFVILYQLAVEKRGASGGVQSDKWYHGLVRAFERW